MNKAAFYKWVRHKLGGLTRSQVNGFEEVLAAIDGAPLSHQAYMLATTWNETAKTMQPVREAFNLSETWRKKHLRYYPHYGRGYVQLTWPTNYSKADAVLSNLAKIKPGDLIKNLDLAMRPDLAGIILRKGMDEGWFTGKANKDYLPMKGVATRQQYINARKIINGTDKADVIEDYAQVFEMALRDAGITE